MKFPRIQLGASRKSGKRIVVRRLSAELFEPKVVLSATTGIWGRAPRLTVSFVPDGTDVASLASDLHAKFAALGDAAAWQEAVLAAFQTWAVHTNADVGLVGDAGQPFGAPGAAARDPRFGDVRVAAVPMSPQVLASAVQHNAAIPTTWAGDLLFNSLGEIPNLDALFSVALHEAGHVLGLDHSGDPASPMHVHGISGSLEPTSADIATLQSLHGERGDDMFDTESRNDTRGSASRIRFTTNLDSFHGETPLIVHGDITTASDVDYYYLTGRSNYDGSITFTARTEGISLLAPRITLYDATGSILDEGVSTSRVGDRVSVQIPAADEDATYFIAVRSAADDLYGVGGYALVTTFDDTLIVPPELIERASSGSYRDVNQDDIQDLFFPDTLPSFDDDMHADDTPLDAPRLKTSEGFAAGSRYEHTAGIVDAADVDVYEFRSPDVAGAEVMTVLVESYESGGLIPAVTILDRNENVLPHAVLANGGGQLILQLANVDRDRNHFIKIAAADPNGPFATGNYRVSIVFGGNEADRSQVAAGTLNAAVPQQAHALFVGETQLMHVALDVDTVVASGDATLVLATLRDQTGETLLRVAASPGEVRSAQALLLPPGEYTWQIAAVRADGMPLSPLSYRLFGGSLSDPTGPALVDPTGDPTYECPDNPDLFCYPGGTTSPNPFLWSEFLGQFPPLPELTPSETLSTLAGDWWSWYWDATQTSAAPQLFGDVYGAVQDAILSVPTSNGLFSNDNSGSQAPVYGAVATQYPQHGTLSLRPDGTFDYTPAPGFVGYDSFAYEAASPSSTAVAAAVSIYVFPTAATLPGDMDGDGRIGVRDAVILRNFVAAQALSIADRVDVNADGIVDAADIAEVVRRFGQSIVPQAADAVLSAVRPPPTLLAPTTIGRHGTQAAFAARPRRTGRTLQRISEFCGQLGARDTIRNVERHSIVLRNNGTTGLR